MCKQNLNLKLLKQSTPFAFSYNGSIIHYIVIIVFHLNFIHFCYRRITCLISVKISTGNQNSPPGGLQHLFKLEISTTFSSVAVKLCILYGLPPVAFISAAFSSFFPFYLKFHVNPHLECFEIHLTPSFQMKLHTIKKNFSP